MKSLPPSSEMAKRAPKSAANHEAMMLCSAWLAQDGQPRKQVTSTKMKEASLKIYGLEEINNSKGYWASNVRYQMKQGISLEKKKKS